MKTISEVQKQNLEKISELENNSNGFAEYAKSIRNTFFLYIQSCIYNKEEIHINEDDVYNVNAVINFLESLKQEN
ncbi:hypothetical protein P3875_01275 [Myroides sp. JBRI-B21084]|uniref:hypothetical protein n=1 Tax=Myroides sp. JBRI-B21084 TaxID=3119977 RepID=UPI0026E29468|nr:hypothetical protein [Paenimyroides cloacae]WKW46732.1 hypothetical protein P3875_01275 [Paenimyroides cloacae]